MFRHTLISYLNNLPSLVFLENFDIVSFETEISAILMEYDNEGFPNTRLLG